MKNQLIQTEIEIQNNNGNICAAEGRGSDNIENAYATEGQGSDNIENAYTANGSGSTNDRNINSATNSNRRRNSGSFGFPSRANTQNFLERGARSVSSICLQMLHDLKERVARELAAEFTGLVNSDAVRRVVNEADALAAMTPFPALFLPVLAEEKVRDASRWEARQRAIRNRSLAFSV